MKYPKAFIDTAFRFKSNYGDDYFSFFAGGVFFICINSQLVYGAPLVADQVLSQEQWLDSQLEIARRCSLPSIMFQHIPWFASDPESKEDNYSEINYNTRKRMLEKLLQAGKLASFYLLLSEAKYSMYNVITIFFHFSVNTPTT